MAVVDVNAGEYMGGPVEPHVLGKREEKPARVHAPQRRKPKVVKRADVIKYEIEERMTVLLPIVQEYERLHKAALALKGS